MFGKKPITVTEEPRKEVASNYPTFTVWKGELANEALKAAWDVSKDKDFVLTMCAENGSFNPYMRHPVQNKNGTWDWAMGLNDAYHKPMIDKIMAKQVSMKEIMQYHYNIYNGRNWTTSCGKTPFCGYNRRHKCNNLIKFK